MNRRDALIILLLLLVSAGVFLPGIDWGLPSRANDPYLYGRQSPWSGRDIVALAGNTEDPDRGADVASHASADRTTPIVLNATATDRARIVRRYRLMSYQPDEWNTLKALSEMKPGQGDLDPKLYQYGGLWVYPVGAMLKIAGLAHLIDLRSDVTWYLDHPEAFGRFYIVARLYSVMWAMIGVAAIYLLVRRIIGGRFFAALAAICYMLMPVVVNMAHEAKPHLAGAVLMLLAVLVGARYVEFGRRRAWIGAAILCGASLGMVLSTLPIFLILPAMVCLRKSSWREKIRVCAMAIGIGLLVYGLTNPYVPLNFLRHRAVLESNLGNSKAMYQPQLSAESLANAAYLIAAGTSPLLALAGAAGGIALGIRAVRTRHDPAATSRRANGLLLAVPALCVLAQWVLFAAGKPGEFGRFMLFADIFLAVEAVVAIATFLPRARATAIISVLLLASIGICGLPYVRAFVLDSRAITGRLVEAERLHQHDPSGRRTIAIFADPAPYCLPPIDLFDGKILLLPKGSNPQDGLAPAEVSVRAVDVPEGANRWVNLWTSTPISWANKPFDVRHR